MTLVQSNAPYRPAFVPAALPVLRAVFRLLPYLRRALARCRAVRRLARDGELGLVVAPVRRAGDLDRHAARRAGRRQLPGRRGGRVPRAFACAAVRRSMRRAAALAVPSGFLQQVFARHGMRVDGRAEHRRPRALPAARLRRRRDRAASRRRAQPRADLRQRDGPARVRARARALPGARA